MTMTDAQIKPISYNDFISVIKHFKNWYTNSRPIALPQSILPVITAIAISYSYSNMYVTEFNIILGLVAMIGVAFGHLAANLFDDYFDYKKQGVDYRRDMTHKGIRARIHKCPYITDGSATTNQLLAACIIFSGIALIAGIVIWFYRGNTILLLGAIAALLIVSYSGIPFRFSYRGVGEIIIGLMFGPLSMLGVFYTCVGDFNISLMYFAIPLGLLVINIIYTHSVIDIEADKEANKHTLAVLIGNTKIMLGVCFLTNLLPFVIIGIGVIVGIINAWYLLVFLTLPMAIHLLYLLFQFKIDPNREFAPKIWMGPFEGWKEKVEAGIGWFLIRWMLARNLVTFFGIIITIVSILLGSM